MEKPKMTPMMSQFLLTKDDYPDCILFYRLGDFYEMFFEDAVVASRELEITLTGKDCGLKERAPMCGVPFHSVQNYIARLVEKGYKVAICEQVEDPKTAKGIVKREVVRVVTPGTIIDEHMLDEKKNNYLSVIYKSENNTGVAFCDISTGELFTTEVTDDNAVINEIARYSPSELILNDKADLMFGNILKNRMNIEPESKDDEYFSIDEKAVLDQFRKKDLSQIYLDGKESALKAVCAMLTYLKHTQKSSVEFIDTITCYTISEYMDIDMATRRNLEITETMREKSKKGSLLWVLDKTKTSMGARLLKQWLEKPLINPILINKRLYSVRELVDDLMMRDEILAILSGMYDVARIVSRVSLGTATPRDLIALKLSLTRLPELDFVLSKAKSPILSEMSSKMDIMEDVCDLLERAIENEPPISVKDGEVIKLGFNEDVDMLRKAMTEGKQWIAEIEAEERKATGIKNLKTGFNKVFGYYIEITKSNVKDAPDTYIRKQTLANCERYITPKLKEIENTILGASERIVNLETHLFDDIRKRVAGEVDRLKAICEIIATVDVICSFAEVSSKYNYTMPEMTADGSVTIKDGRHPVVEKMLKSSMFVPNDTELNIDDDRMLIITGPNMAGKSTYMRQVALITLMAQVGSFVPASYARIGTVDKIFTRVGASDDISSGQSTFMLEMTEVANILQNATQKSLIILDEIGRGTSTFDGLSIAWSVVEYIQNKKKLGAKTLFATHYHELTELEDKLEGVKNYRIAVKKHGDEITFLRKIVRGGADDSYGIEVAALAGVPNEVISRAKKILLKIENNDVENAFKKTKKQEVQPQSQMGFEDAASHEILDELKIMDVTTFTPIEALNKLYQLVQKAKENG